MPSPLLANVLSAQPLGPTGGSPRRPDQPPGESARRSVDQWLRDPLTAVVLWDIDRGNFAAACQSLAAAALRSPHTLRLAATTGLSNADLVVLSEFGVATSLRHPEDLVTLDPMVKAYFATATTIS